jgi:predicted nucleotidyltransferase
MANPLDAAWEVAEFLSQHHISYVVIGGLAVQIWGEPRLTVDADLTIAASLTDGVAPVVRLITQRFRSRKQEPVEFARRNRVILVTTDDDIPVDISLALLEYEESLLARATEHEFAKGKAIRICSAEDLIIHKAVAGRAKDLSDLQGVIDRQGQKLDVRYIRKWLEWFAVLLESNAPLERFETAWQNYRKVKKTRSTTRRRQ